MASRDFENFDFSKSSEWQSYYQNIFPPPDYSRLLKIKQKWYKEHIDSNYDPARPSPQSSEPRGPSQSSASRGSRPNRGQVSTMQLFQVLLFFLSIPGFFFGKALHLIIAGHLAGIIHYHNMPKLTLEYWRPVIADDNLHAIAFAMIFLILPSQSLWIVPAYLGTLLYVSDVLIKHPKVPSKFKEFASKIEERKLLILQARADAEVWIGFGLIFLTFLGYSHWMSPIIYWQYTRMRYVLNYFSKITFSNLRVKGDSLFSNKPGISVAWEKLKSLCEWISKVESNQSASSCQIF